MIVWMTLDGVQTEIQLRWTLSFHLEKMTSLAAVEISIGHPEEIVNQFALQKMSLKEGRGSDSIEINTDFFLCIV